MPETEISVLKEVLCAQQQLLQKLYIELDEEKEAAASAANEALSMILRLQEEKAKLQMEANQYKRMVEERMCHVEQSLAEFKELNYQKEMEIASLEFQVQAYRYKILSMGCSDLGISGSVHLNEGCTCDEEVRLSESFRRIDPHLVTKPDNTYTEQGLIDRVMKENELEDSTSCLDTSKIYRNSGSNECCGYLDQLKKLDDWMKVKCQSKDLDGQEDKILDSETTSCVISSRMEEPPCYYDEEVPFPENVFGRDADEISTLSKFVQDKFEVPRVFEHNNIFRYHIEEPDERILEGENRLQKPELILEIPGKQQPARDRLGKRKLLSFHNELKTYSKQGGIQGRESNSNMSLAQGASGLSTFQDEVQAMGCKVEQLEAQSSGRSWEIIDYREEQKKLLKEIHEQLGSIQNEMKLYRKDKSSKHDDSPLPPLAIPYFWF